MKLLLPVLFLPVLLAAQLPTITAFPSLRIPYNSRGLGMGDNGIATAAENQQLYYNAAKTAFTQHFHRVSASYAPWMNAVSPDTRVMNINYAGNVSNNSALGTSLTYLDYGSMEVRDNSGATLASYKPREYSLGISYALQVGNTAGFAVVMRALGQNVYTDMPRNLVSACGDICYYQYFDIGGENQRVLFGATLSNLGPKVLIAGNTNKVGLPTTAGIGLGYTSFDQTGNEFTIGLDVNKPVISKVWNDLRYSLGIEYGYQSSFYLRGGVSLENSESGNRKFFSLGTGYKGYVSDQGWAIDLHYLVPFGQKAAVSPYQNQAGVTLSVNIGSFQ
jgi:hypothetical protein